MHELIARHYIVWGRVQGVGFRYFVARHARTLHLVGWVRNLADGSVEATAAGGETALMEFEKAVREGPCMSQVDRIDIAAAPAPTATSFEILG